DDEKNVTFWLHYDKSLLLLLFYNERLNLNGA
ncbi:MAG: hypothetical protein ACI9QV_000531, partial [Methylophagaceae bacterium]